ncbi:hypothetical protein GF325_03570 [Candidatus Bathyarchaeota archaeon]|nr:hypothetical protein [Candidatus Bathyarchaeota archaeon]
MDPHQRIMKALNHEEPDRVPTFSQSIEEPFIERFDENVGVDEALFDELFPSLPVDFVFAKALGFDSKWMHLGGLQAPPGDHPDVSNVPEGCTVNNSGRFYKRNSRGENWYQDGALKTPELLKDWISYIKTFTTRDESYFRSFASMWEFGINHGILPIPTIGGPTYMTWSSIGIGKFGYMLRKHRKLVKELITAWTTKTIEAHSLLFEQNVDMVFICDDFAQKDRLMMHPSDFNEVVIPNYNRMVKNAHDHGAKFIVHSDGDLSEAFPGMVDAGVDGAEPLEYEAGMRLKDLKLRFGEDICLIGNVPASSALCVGTAEYTRDITKQCIKDAAAGGGFILSAGANILATTKIENVQVMIETTKKYGQYPIQL